MNNRFITVGIVIVLGISCVCLGIFVFPVFFPEVYTHKEIKKEIQSKKDVQIETSNQISTSTFSTTVTHLTAPTAIKAIYMTSWVAGTPKLRDPLVHLMDTTEVNAVVIDIKDYSGKISFEIENPELKKYGSQEIRIRDLRQFIEELHQKNIYVIGRLATFQDAYMVKVHPEWAVKNEAGTVVWKDHKGISWIDAGARDYWHYITLVAEESHDAGFDEINFDYIRFPSDGNMKDISYPWSKNDPKPTTLKSFFSYLHTTLSTSTESMKISADLFGMTTTATDDMGIGQMFGQALPYFDYIDPMVYPSHYPTAFMGYKNPAQYPYEVVNYALAGAVKKALIASSSPLKIRPWLQDFDLGADYGPVEVRKQIQATYDNKLTSWLLWSASNVYTKGALDVQ